MGDKELIEELAMGLAKGDISTILLGMNINAHIKQKRGTMTAKKIQKEVTKLSKKMKQELAAREAAEQVADNQPSQAVAVQSASMDIVPKELKKFVKAAQMGSLNTKSLTRRLKIPMAGNPKLIPRVPEILFWAANEKHIKENAGLKITA